MSHDHHALDPELTGVEDALGSLAPAPSRLDRDRLMFRAGQAALRPLPLAPQRLWVAIAASLGLIAVGEAAMLAQRPTTQIIEKVVVVRDPAVSPVFAVPDSAPERTVGQPPKPPTFRTFDDSRSFGQTPYDRLTSQVFRYGLDGLPVSPSFRGSTFEPLSPPTRQLLQEELQRILEPGDPS